MNLSILNINMRSFSSFLGKKERENKEHLHILEQILSKAGFEVANHLDDHKEPYIYVKKPIGIDPILEGLSFGGVRIYTRGREILCYRSQNKITTEPFGNTYELDIKGMFKDLVKESSKDRVGHQIIFYVIKELKEFFIKSAEAEKIDDTGGNDAKMGVIGGGGIGAGDYSNNISNDMSWKK